MRQKIKTIEIVHYDCGLKNCNHKKESSAVTCVNRRLNMSKEMYKRTRLTIKFLTTRVPTISIARRHGVTKTVVRNSVVIVVRAIFKKLSDDVKKEHGYKKTIDNISQESEFWAKKIIFLQDVIENEIEALSGLL